MMQVSGRLTVFERMEVNDSAWIILEGISTPTTSHGLSPVIIPLWHRAYGGSQIVGRDQSDEMIS